HLTSVKDPKGLTTTYAWDALDNNTSVTSPDAGKTTRTFDAAGNVLTSTDARGKATTYAYDALNRKISETRAGGPNVQFQYDQGTNGIGRLTKITDGTGSTAYSYDANGRIIQKLQTIGTLSWKTSYAYDAGGRVASVTYPSGTVIAFGYDAAGRVVSAKAGAQNLFTGATYAPFGGVVGWLQGNGNAYTRTIDQNNRVTGFSVPGRSVTLTYDAGDRITGTAVNAGAAKAYAYDALARLTSFTAGTIGQTYTYDAEGNRLTAALKNGITASNFTYAFPSTSNRLASVGGAATETFTYDASGNTLTDAPSYAFTYDDRGRLVSSKIGAIIKTYGVNGLGQRVSKTDAATPSTNIYFVYDEAEHLIGEYNSTGARIEETVWLGDLPVATIQASGFFFVAPDHLGAPYQITNASKAQVWLWDHDPFGTDAPTGSLVYNLRLPGQYYDSETRLNYNYYRAYNPKLGRYSQSDPIGLVGGINTYTYVEGNPLSRFDTAGLSDGIITVAPPPTPTPTPPPTPSSNAPQSADPLTQCGKDNPTGPPERAPPTMGNQTPFARPNPPFPGDGPYGQPFPNVPIEDAPIITDSGMAGNPYPSAQGPLGGRATATQPIGLRIPLPYPGTFNPMHK
ncbi:MAG: RHS repeat protein, partial [Hyphomicrobiales bacterium]